MPCISYGCFHTTYATRKSNRYRCFHTTYETGISNRCGNRKRAVATSRVTKPGRDEPGTTRKRHRRERAEDKDGSRVKESVRPSGRLCARSYPAVHPAAVSRRDHDAAGPGEGGAAGRRGRPGGIPQRVWQTPEADPDMRDDYRAAAPCAQPDGALRQSAATAVPTAHEAGGRAAPPVVSARIGARRFRAGVAGAVG